MLKRARRIATCADSQRYPRCFVQVGFDFGPPTGQGGTSVDRDQGQSAASSQAPARRRLDQRIVRSMLWLVVIVVAIPIVGFVVLIGVWLVLNPRW
jgi:hypothetical protein